jgi:hypothetical protein
MTTRTREQVAADRRKIADLLLARSQAEPMLAAKDLLRLLNWPLQRLRMMEREVRAIRSDVAAVARRQANSQHSRPQSTERSHAPMLDPAKLDAILNAIQKLEARLVRSEQRVAAFESEVDALVARSDYDPNGASHGAPTRTH